MCIFLPLSIFVIVVLVHSILARFKCGRSLVLCFICLVIPMSIVLILLSLHFMGFGEHTITSMLIYFAACELYVFLFTLAANGVSISILDSLHAKKMGLNVLTSKHATDLMVERRIKQLEIGGLLIEENERLQLSKKGKKLVTLFLFFQNFFGHTQKPSVCIEKHAKIAPNEELIHGSPRT